MIKYMNRRNSLFSKNKIKRITYNLININESTVEKICIKADKENEKKYREFIGKTSNITRNWENTGIKIYLEVPPPPKPNNYDRLLDFKKKNVLRPAIKQSAATLFLNMRGYVLNKDYEAFQAIDLANSLKNYENDKNIGRTTKSMSLKDNVKLKNIEMENRRKSMNDINKDFFYKYEEDSLEDYELQDNEIKGNIKGNIKGEDLLMRPKLCIKGNKMRIKKKSCEDNQFESYTNNENNYDEKNNGLYDFNKLKQLQEDINGSYYEDKTLRNTNSVSNCNDKFPSLFSNNVSNFKNLEIKNRTHPGDLIPNNIPQPSAPTLQSMNDYF